MGRGLVRQVDRGFDATKEHASELRPGSAADGSKNVLYRRGLICTPHGFDKVASGSLPLDSGNQVLGLFPFMELDGTQNMLAVTLDKIYNRNYTADSWEDKTQSGVGLGADIYYPVTFAVSLHTDGLLLNGSGDAAYRHGLVSTGGQSPIQRWAGKYEDDFADLLGADGYHDSASGRTTHYALQIGVFSSHVLLISPKIADANNNLVENRQQMRWSVTGKLEVWTGTTSGYVELFETGDENLRGALLGNQWIQYQTHSIWSLFHVGGTDIFRPWIEFPDIGLLGFHLLCPRNNVHYFVGNDYNVYAYRGGSDLNVIGKNIHRYLQRDLTAAYKDRCWMTMGAANSRLWIFYVPEGSEYCIEGYGIDVLTGSWMKRDFSNKWSSGGISSVALIGSGSFTSSQTYAYTLLERSPSKTVAIGGCVRSSNTVTVTTGTAHGFITGETVTLANVDSGGETNAFSGDHTIASVPSTTTFTFSQTGADESNLAAGTASVDKAATYTDYVNAEKTYRDMMVTTLLDETICLGDSAGYVYQFDADLTDDDGNNIAAQHLTEVIDGGDPGIEKVWPAISIEAAGTTIVLSYRTGNFETTDTGWSILATLSLTSEFVEYYVPIEDTSKRIQFKFANSNGSDFKIASYEVLPAAVLESLV